MTLISCNMSDVHRDLQEYYGNTLYSSSYYQELQQSCTSSNSKASQKVKHIMSLLHNDVVSRYYGCGLVFPEAVEGCKIVDLGSGSGRDCYILSKLVGPTGYVTGVDMTKEQLQVARNHIDYHMKQFGYQIQNVKFLEGYIEDLKGCGIPPDSIDIIVSNCVICVCSDKQQVFQEAYDILKPGGELYFSDMYADGHLSHEAKTNKVLHAEGFNALLWTDLMKIACEIGFAPPVLVDVASLPIDHFDSELIQLLGETKFCSATYRLFKIQQDKSSHNVIEVQYRGTIPDLPDEVALSHNITISKHSPTLLFASVAQLLMKSRLAPHFTFTPSASSISAYPNLSDFVLINPFEVLNKMGAEENKDCLPTSQSSLEKDQN